MSEKESKPSAKSAVAANNQELAEITSSNLKKLISHHDLTQKDLADILCVAPASMTDYCKGRRTLGTEHLLVLKKHFDISIDDFLTKSITPPAVTVVPRSTVIDKEKMETYHKYCAAYYMYYFDTSKSKGRDLLPPKQSLHYGILYIYENPTSLDEPEFCCAAVLGISKREDVTRIKEKLDEMKDPERVIDHIGKNYDSMAYYGDFSLTQYHAFVSINHASTDKALLIFHRVDNNKPEYIGGFGTINSVSKGREHTPVIQFIGISRYPLSLSEEEIHYKLLLDYPTFEADPEMVDEMIMNFKALYADPNGAIYEQFSEYQKAVMVRSTLERFVKKSLERNMFRYGKISGATDDDQWYHAIKAASVKSSD
ncbi:MAG: helix-turn-helix transcriptional regulator [Lachnospiraceae bacterium]|nr:helix-turn-helix transcriptional regulator [Lachnospiraceae bacterium]